jgi:hypothetical protein
VLEHVIGFHDVLLLRPLGLKPDRPRDEPCRRWELTVDQLRRAFERDGLFARALKVPAVGANPATQLAAAPVAVIGADCAPLGGTGTTANGATAYCSTLQNTSATIWSLTQGDMASPTVTTEPTDGPLPIAEESPVRVCMQQTGQTRRQCREDIRRSKGLP